MIVDYNINSTEDLINVVSKYIEEENIKYITIFAKGIDNVLKLSQKLEHTDVSIFVTTFPTNEPIYLRNAEDEIEETYPEILSNENKKILKDKGIHLTSSTLPLSPVIVPGHNDNPYKIINQTLNLFGNGVDLCVQAAMMLTDNGHIKPTDRVIAMNSQVAIDLNTCNSRFLFHPELGLEINQIIK